MAIVVKKKKRDYKAAGAAGAGAASALRPHYVPKTPPCTFKCPSDIDIRGYIMHVSQSELYKRDFEESMRGAWDMLTNTNPFPGTTGRVCPHPCESECNRGQLEGALNINNIERYMGDYGIKNNLPLPKLSDESKSESVAIIGAGPAGLSCAYQLARRGYKTTVYESYEKAGGMLRYGIPAYRLPDDLLDAEIKRIQDIGVEIKLNTRVGKDISVDELRKNNKVVFVGIGAHAGKKLNVPGEDAPNVMTGAEFLHKVNAGEKVDIGDKVVVIGGGNSAIDAARASLRLGADVTISYRRTRDEMPAIEHEIHSAEEEGIKFEFLTAPVEVVQSGGKATGLKLQRMELGEPDDSGRRRPVPVEGSEFTIDATFICPSISQEPVWEGLDDVNVKNEWGWVSADAASGRTSEDGVFAGGDISGELMLATEAIGLGRFAAEGIIDYLNNVEPQKLAPVKVVRTDTMYTQFFPRHERHETKWMSADEVKNSLTLEPMIPLTDEEFKAEVTRCMSCGLCFDCDNCWMFCSDQAVSKVGKEGPRGTHYEFNHQKCQGCKKCAEACPCGFIDMK